jgi:hypothetical protein
MNRASQVSVKKPYHPPKLIVYGDLTQLTMTIPKGKGQLDGTKKFQT